VTVPVHHPKQIGFGSGGLNDDRLLSGVVCHGHARSRTDIPFPQAPDQAGGEAINALGLIAGDNPVPQAGVISAYRISIADKAPICDPRVVDGFLLGESACCRTHPVCHIQSGHDG
jgi:hypothetical protein